MKSEEEIRRLLFCAHQARHYGSAVAKGAGYGSRAQVDRNGIKNLADYLLVRFNEYHFSSTVWRTNFNSGEWR